MAQQMQAWKKKAEDTIPSMRKNVMGQLSDIQKWGVTMQQKLDLATRQEHQLHYNLMMGNNSLGVNYRVQFADDNFGLMSAPWLRGMTNKLGRKVCLEISMIKSGWEELAITREQHGLTEIRCNVWEPYVVKGAIKEVKVVRDLNAETAWQFTKNLKRMEDGHHDEPKAEFLNLVEHPPLWKQDDAEMEERLMLEDFMVQIARVHIFICYNFANWISYGDSDITTDAPTIIQNSNRDNMGAGGHIMDENIEAGLIQLQQQEWDKQHPESN